MSESVQLKDRIQLTGGTSVRILNYLAVVIAGLIWWFTVWFGYTVGQRDVRFNTSVEVFDLEALHIGPIFGQCKMVSFDKKQMAFCAVEGK